MKTLKSLSVFLLCSFIFSCHKEDKQESLANTSWATIAPSEHNVHFFSFDSTRIIGFFDSDNYIISRDTLRILRRKTEDNIAEGDYLFEGLITTHTDSALQLQKISGNWPYGNTAESIIKFTSTELLRNKDLKFEELTFSSIGGNSAPKVFMCRLDDKGNIEFVNKAQKAISSYQKGKVDESLMNSITEIISYIDFRKDSLQYTPKPDAAIVEFTIRADGKIKYLYGSFSHCPEKFMELQYLLKDIPNRIGSTEYTPIPPDFIAQFRNNYPPVLETHKFTPPAIPGE